MVDYGDSAKTANGRTGEPSVAVGRNKQVEPSATLPKRKVLYLLQFRNSMRSSGMWLDRRHS